MAIFVARHDSPLPPAVAWDRLTTWSRHAKYVPLTTISVITAGSNAVGTIFVARTHLGPLSFDDPMEVVEWSPPVGDRPGRCRLIKRGTVMLGWAELEIASQGPGSRAAWTEQLTVSRMPKWADPLTQVSSRLMFAHVLRRLLEDEPPHP